MKTYIYTLVVSLFLLSFASCEETVDLKLNNAPPHLVIDGMIGNDEDCRVKLTRMQDFDNNGPANTVSGAAITLSDDNGGFFTLTEVTPGLYTASALGVAGREYELSVTVEGETHVARSFMPQPIAIDSIYIYNLNIGTSEFYSPIIEYRDPANEKNFYYATYSVNGYELVKYYLDDDLYRDGLNIQNILFYDTELNKGDHLEIGDSIHVKIQTLDKRSFDYYNSLEADLTGGNNPISNFTGKVLGNFKAYSATEASVIISEDVIHSIH